MVRFHPTHSPRDAPGLTRRPERGPAVTCVSRRYELDFQGFAVRMHDPCVARIGHRRDQQESIMHRPAVRPGRQPGTDVGAERVGPEGGRACSSNGREARAPTNAFGARSRVVPSAVARIVHVPAMPFTRTTAVPSGDRPGERTGQQRRSRRHAEGRIASRSGATVHALDAANQSRAHDDDERHSHQ